MKRPTPSATVGFATLIAFVLFLGFTFAIRGTLFGGAMHLNVLFERVSGLEVGSPVYVAGVYAGEVTRISYQPQHMGKPVVVSLSLNQKFKFYRNANVKIIQSGIIGDKRVEIDPGTSEYPELPYGESIEGEPQFDIEQTLKQGQQIVEDLSLSIASLRQLITDEANLRAIRNTIQSLEHSIQTLNDILEENRENIQETTLNFREASERVDILLGRAETVVDHTDQGVAETRANLERSLKEIEDQVRRAGDNIEHLSVKVGKTADETTDLVSATQEQLGPTLEQIENAATSLNEILTSVREGKGTLGQLINNPSPFVELDRTLRAVRRALLGRSGIEATVSYEGLGEPLVVPEEGETEGP